MLKNNFEASIDPGPENQPEKKIILDLKISLKKREIQGERKQQQPFGIRIKTDQSSLTVGGWKATPLFAR